MELTYLKLDAKKNLVNNQAKLFFASIFPYVAIFSLAVLNYYLYLVSDEKGNSVDSKYVKIYYQ